MAVARWGLCPAGGLANAAALYSDLPPSDRIAGITGPEREGGITLSADEVRVLKDGMRLPADIAIADALFQRIDPDMAGALTRGTRGVAHSFVQPRTGSTGAVTTGATAVTFAHGVERTRAPAAKRISLSVFDDAGADLLTLLHERVHASAYSDLPAGYQVPIPDVPREGAVGELYEAVLNNRYWDEALAFSAMMEFASKFKAAAERDIASFGAQGPTAQAVFEKYGAAYGSEGVEGVRRAVGADAAYYPYKVAALYIALLRKTGQGDFPDWGDLIERMGGRNDGGQYVITPQAASNFLSEIVMPMIKGRIGEARAALMLAGASGRRGAALGRAALYAMGLLDPAAAADFLRRDFDALVELAGELMGDRPKVARGPTSEAKTALPPRPTPMKPGDIGECSRRPDVVADKVEIAAKEAAILHRGIVDDVTVRDNWGEYLAYAERADPASAAEVYSRLVDCLERGDTPQARADKGKLSKLTEHRWKLGVSLARAGYAAEGRRHIDEAVSLSFQAGRTEHIATKDAWELGLADVVWRIGDHALAVITSAMAKVEGGEKLADAEDKDLNAALGLLFEIGGLKRREGAEASLAPLIERARAELARVWTAAGDKMIGSRSDHLISWALAAEGFRGDGMRFLRAYSEHAFDEPHAGVIGLFREAAASIPASAPDEERRGLVNEWLAVVAKQRRVLPNSYIPFIWGETVQAAEVLLGGKDPATRQEGLSLLDGLPSSIRVYRGGESRRSGYMAFSHQLLRAIALIEHIGAFPREGQGDILASARTAVDVFDVVAHGGAGQHCAARFRIIEEAIRLGETRLAMEVMQRFMADATKGIKQAGTGLAADDTWVEKYNWEIAERRARTMFPLYRGLMGRMDEGILADMEADRQGGRNLFPADELMEGLELLGRPWARAILAAQGRAGFAGRLAREAVERQILEANKYHERSIFDALRGLGLPPADLDACLARLVEGAIPEEGLTVERMFSQIGQWRDADKLIEFAMGNPATPETEAALISRYARLARSVNSGVAGWERGGALGLLSRAMRTMGDSSIMDPARREALAVLREGRGYAEAVRRLYPFVPGADRCAASDAGPVRAKYTTAVARRDGAALAAMRAEVGEILSREIEEAFASERSQRRGYVLMEEMAGGLSAAIHNDWQVARASGDGSIASRLLDLWTALPEAEDAQAMRIELWRALGDEALDTKTKRVIFAELVRTTDIQRSPYKDNLWRAVAGGSDVRREAAFYELATPAIRQPRQCGGDLEIEASPDKLVALAFTGGAGWTEAAALRHRRWRESPGWKMDPSDPRDWEIYAETGASDIRADRRRLLLGALLAAEAGIRADTPDSKLLSRLEQVAHRKYGGNYPHEGGSSWKEYTGDFWHGLNDDVGMADRDPKVAKRWAEGIRDAAGHFERPLSRAEAADAVARFETIPDRIKAAYDSIKVGSAELPRFIRDRAPLTQFLLTRFYLALDAPKMGAIADAMRGVDDADALRIFLEKAGLEKIGQFLSNWPEVPQGTRAELAHLQDRVTPSRFEEVVETIKRSLPAGADKEAIVANLVREPLGSGTIGECYESRLADGQRIVVKVIPPSKRARFEGALHKMAKVRETLSLHLRVNPDAVPGGRAAERLIGMYLDMVEPELDLMGEAQNAQALAARVRSVRVPKYYTGEGLVTGDAAVIAFVDGVRLAEIDDPAIRGRAAASIRESLLAEQIPAGRYHSDIHPGNVLVDEATGEVTLLDFGQLGSIKAEKAARVQGELMQALVARDAGRIVAVLEGMTAEDGDIGGNYQRPTLVEEVGRIVARWDGDPAGFTKVAGEIARASSERDLLLDRSYLLLLKGITAAEGTVRLALERPMIEIPRMALREKAALAREGIASGATGAFIFIGTSQAVHGILGAPEDAVEAWAQSHTTIGAATLIEHGAYAGTRRMFGLAEMPPPSVAILSFSAGNYMARYLGGIGEAHLTTLPWYLGARAFGASEETAGMVGFGGLVATHTGVRYGLKIAAPKVAEELSRAAAARAAGLVPYAESAWTPLLAGAASKLSLVGLVLFASNTAALASDLFDSAENNRAYDLALTHFRDASSINRVRAFLWGPVIRNDMRMGYHREHVARAWREIHPARAQ